MTEFKRAEEAARLDGFGGGKVYNLFVTPLLGRLMDLAGTIGWHSPTRETPMWDRRKPPENGYRERGRRARQVMVGQITASNGLVR